MTVRSPASTRKSRQSNRFGVQWMFTVVLSIAVLLGQAIPSMAGQNDRSSASWLEICGDGGSYFILVGADGKEQAPDCEHCDFCLISTGENLSIHSTPANAASLIGFTVISYSAGQVDLPEHPEQYWSASRGPPIASTDNKMTTLASLFTKEPAAISSSEWSIPCV